MMVLKDETSQFFNIKPLIRRIFQSVIVEIEAVHINDSFYIYPIKNESG